MFPHKNKIKIGFNIGKELQITNLLKRNYSYKCKGGTK